MFGGTLILLTSTISVQFNACVKHQTKVKYRDFRGDRWRGRGQVEENALNVSLRKIELKIRYISLLLNR